MFLVPTIYALTTVFAKLSPVQFFFSRCLSPQNMVEVMCPQSHLCVVGYNITIFFVIIFACHPFKRHRDVGVTERSCINQAALNVATAVPGIISDLVLLLMLIRMILELQMPSRQKVGLMLLFSIGSAEVHSKFSRYRTMLTLRFSALVTSVIRLVIILVADTWCH